MAIQIGTVDGLVTISQDNINCFTNAIYTFSQQGGVAYAIDQGVSLGTAFQRFVEPVYTGISQNFNIASIGTPAHTKSGNEQSPARGTFCRKMGILDINDHSNIFRLTPLALELYHNNITIEEYAFILMTKQGIFKDGAYVKNLFTFIASWFDKNTTITDADLKSAICSLYEDNNIEKTRIDIILNALSLCKLIVSIGSGKYVLASIPAANILKDFASHCKLLSKAIRDDEVGYTDYIGSFNNGIFDILSSKNLNIYSQLYPNIGKYIKKRMDTQYQIIFYGAPGTGKSHKIKEQLEGVSKKNIFRTTFHPDSDYSTFVGAYKPQGTTPKKPSYTIEELITILVEIKNSGTSYPVHKFAVEYYFALEKLSRADKEAIITAAEFTTNYVTEMDKAIAAGKHIKRNEKDSNIIYRFLPQVFTNAYVQAWKNQEKPIYLIIEEINRGNCAQIFGDLFQLLDRDKVTGKSEYPIKADKDLVAYIEKELGVGHDGIKNGELCLPSNLIIYATMNTSDQSLFPMDSAFKRRWDWEYVPINYSKDIDSGKFIIEVDEDTKYSWVEFLESVNDKIYDATNSEDKQMGNFFIKKSIKANEFVNKVMFYLWNEVCKEEYGTQRNFFRKGKDGKTEFKFTELFGDNQTTILKEFMTSLGVEPIGKKTEEPAAE